MFGDGGGLVGGEVTGFDHGKVRGPKVGKQTYGLEITSLWQRECMREECTCSCFSDIVERTAHRLQCG